jgi:hypothetical protein
VSKNITNEDLELLDELGFSEAEKVRLRAVGAV